MSFTFAPDLGVREVWQWQTDIITSRNGSEVRISLQSQPEVVQSLSYDAVTPSERRALRTLLAADLDGPSVVPLFGWFGAVNADAASGATDVDVNADLMSLAVGDQIVFIHEQNGETFSREVSAIAGNTVTVATVIPQDIDTTWVAYKGFTVLQGQNNSTTWRQITGRSSFEMQSYISPEVVRAGSSATINEFNSLPVLESFILENAQENLTWPLDVTDFGIGRVNVFSLRTVTQANMRRLRFSVDRLEATEVDYWREFLNSVRGAQRAFLIDSQLEDIELAAPLVQGASTLMASEDLGPLFLNHPSFENFKIVYSDGTSSMHTASGTLSDGTVSFSPALPSDPKVANVTRISYLLKSRMSDRLEWRHGAVRSQISFDITTTDNG